MKTTSILSLILAFTATGFAAAQSSGTIHSSMPGMQHEMAAGDAGKNAQASTEKAPVYQANAVVKAAKPEKSSVTLAHEAIPALKWPAMTMSFVVKDAKLFDKLAVGSKVKVEFTKQGSDYVVTAVK